MSDDAQPSVTPPPTAPQSTPRYNFSGSVIGAAAHFHKLDDKTFDYLIHVPTLGASVLSKIGGQCLSELRNYSYEVEQPRKRKLLTVDHIKSFAHGSKSGT